MFSYIVFMLGNTGI